MRNTVTKTKDGFKFKVSRELLLSKFNEFKGVFGDEGFKEVLFFRDVMIIGGDNVYVTQFPIDMPEAWFLSYDGFVWLESQSAEKFMITVNSGGGIFEPVS